MEEVVSYTKGPWQTEIDAYGDEWWFGGDNGGGQIVLRCADAVIAISGLSESGEARAEEIATFALLRAAPALLEAAQQVIAIAGVGPGPLRAAATAALEAAVTDALGEDQP